MRELARNASDNSKDKYYYWKYGVRINDVLWYDYAVSDTRRPYPNEIGVHVSKTNIDPSFAGAKKFAEKYKMGLMELARRIEADPNAFAGAKQIVAASWIVHAKPGLLRLMGFTITERNDDLGYGVALMTKEDFLTRYGSKHK
jgi:hypothetical protein